jgi:hypothetical protein
MEHEIAEMERRRHEAMSRACEIPRLTRIQVVDSFRRIWIAHDRRLLAAIQDAAK